MHEYALVDALLRRVGAEAAARGAIAVTRVRLTVGQVSGVEPELVRSAFDLVRAGTACARAELEIATCAARFSCPSCGVRVDEGAALRCPRCGGPARLEPGGDSLVIESIELELP